MTTTKLNCAIALAGAAAIASATILLTQAASKDRAGTGASSTETGEQSSKSQTIEIAFITHLDAGLPEQDVFIERKPGSGKVYRVTVGDHDMKAPLYKSAEMVPHNPFDPAAVGPHPKGESLNMTTGQWLKHQGVGTYSYKNGVGSLDLSFAGLVPDGVYTMWHAFLPATPPEPFTGALDLPLGAPDGSESVFRADGEGRAKFVHTFKPGLQMSDVWTTAVLAIAYHSDGKTYGGDPGESGYNSHVPLFAMLPKRAGIE